MARKKMTTITHMEFKIVNANKIDVTIVRPYTFKKLRVCITEGDDFKKLMRLIEKGTLI